MIWKLAIAALLALVAAPAVTLRLDLPVQAPGGVLFVLGDGRVLEVGSLFPAGLI